ncbi:hypothetical protein [Duganella phyllosphaerae]|uniref:hypothetical protein n=1 Tax=Duganella phyllosphaerae TaxID=762836 RepID=UPI00114D2C93|nr:hypothetical protein [Duganella phyllosphaerae]
MTSMTENFAIGRVDHIEQGSKEIGSTVRYKVSVRTATIVCRICNHTWIASERSGLRQVMGAMHIECPECRTTEQVHPSVFGL